METTAQAGQYVPPKLWKDLNDSEKIERTREQIKIFMNSVYSDRARMNKLESNFRTHGHSPAGTVMTQLDSGLFGGALGNVASSLAKNANPDEVYF